MGIDYGAEDIWVDKKEVSVHISTRRRRHVRRQERVLPRRAGLLMVIDVTRRETFEISDWVLEIKQELIREGRGLDTTIVFLAAKCDSWARRWMRWRRGSVELHGFIYCETQPRPGSGITDMFQGFSHKYCPPGRVRDGIIKLLVRKAAGKHYTGGPEIGLRSVLDQAHRPLPSPPLSRPP